MWAWLSSGVGGLIVGATVGLLLGVFFEDLLKDWVQTSGRFLKRWTRRSRQIPDFGREFQLGPLHVPCVIIEGDGEYVIGEENLRVLVNPVEVNLPQGLVDRRAGIADKQLRKREAGENYAWNGRMYAVEDLIISRIGSNEESSVTLILKYSDYFTFLATQQLDRRLPGGATPRSLYVEGRKPREIPDFMKSCFGLNVAVVTADNWLVISRRSNEVEVGKGLWNSSVNEGLSRDKDSQFGRPPNLFDATRRGVREELHLLPDQYQLKLLAFHVVTSLTQWGSLFILRLNSMSKVDFESHVSRGIEDGWEHPEFDYVPFKPNPVLRYLLRADRISKWAPAAPVLFYLSLVNSYGRREVDEAAGRLSREYS